MSSIILNLLKRSNYSSFLLKPKTQTHLYLSLSLSLSTSIVWSVSPFFFFPYFIKIVKLYVTLMYIKKRQNADAMKKANLMRLDKMKTTALFFISSLLMHPDKDKSYVGDRLLRIIDDLDACCDFPWGRSSYVYLMRNLKRMDTKSKSSIVYHLLKTWCPNITRCHLFPPPSFIVWYCHPTNLHHIHYRLWSQCIKTTWEFFSQHISN